MKNHRIVRSIRVLVLTIGAMLMLGTAVMAQEATAADPVGVAYRGHVQNRQSDYQ